MSISKSWVSDPKNQKRVLELYRSKKLLTTEQIAERVESTFHNVSHILKTHMPEKERRTLAKLRYSASKTGSKNPMQGKTGKAHHNWVGECEDGYGYLTCIHNGKRQQVHRVVMAKMIGIEEIPEKLVVHHIDGDKKNNRPSNLALANRGGHRRIHSMQEKDSMLLKSRKSTIADALKYMT